MKPNKLDKYLRVLSAIVAILLIIIIILGGKLYGRVREKNEPVVKNEKCEDRHLEEINDILASLNNILDDSRGSNSDMVDLGSYKITAYTAGYESTGKTPEHPAYGITASGAEVKEGITVASDWEVLPVGSKVYIEDVGFRWVEDRGGAVKGQHIDIYIEDLTQALEWGVQEKRVYLLGE